MRIGNLRLPASWNYDVLRSRLVEVFSLVDRNIGVVDEGRVHDSRIVTGSAAVQNTDSVLFVNASATATVTLLPSGEAINKRVVVANLSANPVIINADGSETINGTATVTLSTQFSSADLVPTGTGWVRL